MNIIDRVVSSISNLKSGKYDYFTVGGLVAIIATAFVSPPVVGFAFLALDCYVRWQEKKRGQ